MRSQQRLYFAPQALVSPANVIQKCRALAGVLLERRREKFLNFFPALRSHGR